ncbi:MAG TPA: VWA domain-containing protein, partial [Phycisphaerae bacterium]|nr:VWA domain-containing protein [Phycisphaerae bacterium]
GMIEVEYLFPVPPDAAVDSMTLVVNGKEFAAKLLKADEARRIYEDIVRRKKDPALLEYAGFGLYRTRAFPLEPGKPCKVLVTYKNTCRKDRDLTEVWYPLNTEKFSAKPIDSVRVRVDIKADFDITAVYSPSHDLKTERKGPRQVIAVYEAKSSLPTTDFQVYYKAANEDVGATLLTWQPEDKADGYFLMLVSPNPRASAEKVVPKDVVVVLDHSGSMSGEKLGQAKDALRFVLRNLNPKDRFNVVLYNDQVDAVFDRVQAVREDALNEAMGRIDRLDATGGTNIHEALQTALGQCTDKRRPSYVLFLTDGQPTVGKTKEADILSDTKVANQVGARVFAFGVGYDPNVRLLDKLVAENRGRSEYVKPKEAIESKVSSLYTKIKNPVMTGLSVSLEGLRLREMYPREMGDLFDGDQVMLVGRYDAGDARKLPKADGKGRSTLVVKGVYEGRERAFEYPMTVNGAGKKSYQFVEKLWAIRRVGWLLDEIQLHGKSQEIIDELVRLSRDYGIMTPYTSFLADERTPLADGRALREAGAVALQPLDAVSGELAHRGARNRKLLSEAEGLALFAAKPMAAPAPASGPAGAGNKANGAGGRSIAGAAVIGYADKEAHEAGQMASVENIRQIGNYYVLYRRGKIWVMPKTAKLDLAKDADQIVQVKRFTEEYFGLARVNTRQQNEMLATQQAGETLLVELRGKVYSISD